MKISFVPLCMTLVACMTPVSAAEKFAFIESIVQSISQRPWLLGVYVFAVGLPIILFISFMWPDKRFGPPGEEYYYKKSDDAQPDDPEFSQLRGSADTNVSQSRKVATEEEPPSTHKRMLSRHVL